MFCDEFLVFGYRIFRYADHSSTQICPAKSALVIIPPPVTGISKAGI